jgi:ribonuclease P protein subunit RPR2
MAKAKNQNRDDAPNPNSVANKDVMQRLNFLYQAGAYLDSIPPPTIDQSSSKKKPLIASASCPERPVYKNKYSRNVELTTADLSSTYVGAVKTIGKKTVVKL